MGRSSGASGATSSLDKINRGGGTGHGQNEALRRISKLVATLLARNDAVPFAEPVDWRGLELWDYPKIIKKVMDLGTVKRKLDSGKYKTASECAEDIRLVWTNCMTYNADGSDFYLLADTFLKKFDEKYRRIKAEFDTGDDDERDVAGGMCGQQNENEPPSLELRTKFAANLFRLNGDELGYVLQLLDLRCPCAVEKVPAAVTTASQQQVPTNPYASSSASLAAPAAQNTCSTYDTELEVNVDAISTKIFRELDRFVKDKLYSREPVVAAGSFQVTGSASAPSEGGTAKKKRKR